MSEHAGSGPAVKPPHPFFYFLLFLPFGATAGFITVTIGALASKQKIDDAVVASLTAVNVLPHTWKFLWAPLVDTLWTGRGWYVTTNLISSGCIVALGFIPITDGNIGLMQGIIFINGLATTFIGMCTEALMAKLTPPDQRGSAAGWSQAGNLGGMFVGGLGLMLAKEFEQQWVPFVIVGGLLLACSIVLFTVKEPPSEPKSFGAELKTLGRDLKGLLFDERRWSKVKPKPLLFFPPIAMYALSGAGILSITLSMMPIGSGGAQNIFPLMGADWGASDNVVAITNGLVTGGAMILGSLFGGKVAGRIDKRWAYAISGVTLACFAFAMALAPKTRETYIAGCLLYGFGLGMCYATFTAFVLDIIGHTGGATKYNIFASLANMPIMTMALVDGWASKELGRVKMLYIDGLAGVAGATLLMSVVFLLRKKKLDPAPAE